LPRSIVVSVFPESAKCRAIGKIVAPFRRDWAHVPVSGDDARTLLGSGSSLLVDIERDPFSAKRDSFSKSVLNVIPRARQDDRYFVISPTVCPLDLVRDHRGNWGIVPYSPTFTPSPRDRRCV
jgi:hypothetical protein